MTGKSVCRFHGGKSPSQVGSANGRYRHGAYTLEAIAERRYFAALLAEVREVARLVAG